MSHASRCSSCGAELLEVSSQGLCPVCLLKLGLSDPSLSLPVAEKDEPDATVRQVQPAEPEARRFRRSGPILAAAGALLLAAAVAMVFLHRSVPAQARVLRFTLSPTKDAIDFAVSPDGLRFVFTATDSQGLTSLWLHSFDAFAERQLPDT